MTEVSFPKRLRLPLSFVAKALAESCWIRPFYWKKMPPQPRSRTQMPMTVLHPPFWRMPSRCYNLTVPNFNKNRVVNILWHISTTTVSRGGAVFPSHMVAASQLRMYSVPSWQHVLFCFSFFSCVGHHSVILQCQRERRMHVPTACFSNSRMYLCHLCMAFGGTT